MCSCPRSISSGTPTYSGPRVMHERPAEEGLAPSAGALPPTWRRLKPQVMAEQSVAMENSDRLKSNVRWKLAGRPEDLGPQARFPIPLLAQ